MFVRPRSGRPRVSPPAIPRFPPGPSHVRPTPGRDANACLPPSSAPRARNRPPASIVRPRPRAGRGRGEGARHPLHALPSPHRRNTPASGGPTHPGRPPLRRPPTRGRFSTPTLRLGPAGREGWGSPRAPPFHGHAVSPAPNALWRGRGTPGCAPCAPHRRLALRAVSPPGSLPPHPVQETARSPLRAVAPNLPTPRPPSPPTLPPPAPHPLDDPPAHDPPSPSGDPPALPSRWPAVARTAPLPGGLHPRHPAPRRSPPTSPRRSARSPRTHPPQPRPAPPRPAPPLGSSSPGLPTANSEAPPPAPFPVPRRPSQTPPLPSSPTFQSSPSCPGVPPSFSPPHPGRAPVGPDASSRRPASRSRTPGPPRPSPPPPTRRPWHLAHLPSGSTDLLVPPAAPLRFSSSRPGRRPLSLGPRPLPRSGLAGLPSPPAEPTRYSARQRPPGPAPRPPSRPRSRCPPGSLVAPGRRATDVGLRTPLGLVTARLHLSPRGVGLTGRPPRLIPCPLFVPRAAGPAIVPGSTTVSRLHHRLTSLPFDDPCRVPLLDAGACVPAGRPSNPDAP